MSFFICPSACFFNISKSLWQRNKHSDFQISGEMPCLQKKDYYRSYGQKLISLFAKLLFLSRSHLSIKVPGHKA